MWALVGTGLLIKGGTLFYGGRTMSEIDPNRGAFGIAEGIGLVVALGLGFVKGNFVLPKIARKNILRIEQLPEKSPIYMTFSLKSWILIGGMMLIGLIIRMLGVPNLIRGVILVAVGLALALGSRAYLAGQPVTPIEKRASS
jgi:hypothetical protein